MERLLAGLGNHRSLLVRHEYYSLNFLGFTQLACSIIWLKRL